MSIKNSFIKDIKELLASVQPKPDAEGYYKDLDNVEADLISSYSSCFEELATYDGLEIPKVDDASVLESIKKKLSNNTDPELINGLCVGVDCPDYLYCDDCIFSKDNRSSLMRYLGMDHTEPQVKELPKLTVEVFDHPDCPTWANYAAVNKNGRVLFYEDKKSVGVKADIGFFDASDWPNTIIKRPKKQEQLPDWCKVGGTCYDYGAGYYFKVTGIDDEKSEVSISWEPSMLADVISYSIFKEYARQARKRQFNEKEMKALIGKVLSDSGGAWRSLIIWASGDEVTTYHRSYSADTLIDEGCIVDGNPCYKLEHLNEKGEWVE